MYDRICFIHSHFLKMQTCEEKILNESAHLSEALEGFLTRPDNGWFTPLVVAVDGLEAEQAAKVPAPRFDSVWAVLNHLAYRQEFVLLRIRGQEAEHWALDAEKGWPPYPGRLMPGRGRQIATECLK